MRETPQEERFRIVYECNYARILGYALRRTTSPEDAADVVADTFTTAWRKFDDIPGGEEATLWLYGVARRTIANHHRRRANRSDVLEMLTRDYEEVVWLDPLPAGGSSSALAEAWMALRSDDRDLLGLVAWETLTTDQIAAVLGCSRGVAKVRVHRARRRFARELGRRGIEVERGAHAASSVGAKPGPHGPCGAVNRSGAPRSGPPAVVKPSGRPRHVQVGRADALPDTEAM
jgi:RNA polymerase sigma factor (sigma-70 family)